MSVPLEFWFEFASTYSYPAAMRIEEEAARAGVAVAWRAFLLGPIFKAQGWNDSPFNLYPSKGRYMWRDLARICEAQGLALQKPSVFPRNGLLAARVACRFAEAGWLPDFVRSVYRANFAEDRDIGEAAVVAGCLEAAGQNPDAILRESQSAAAKAALRARNEVASQRGLFGAPSFWVGSELFWGNDRLGDALAWAKRLAAKARFEIRDARPNEASVLSTLAYRSKAHWGYDRAFMESARDELALSPGAIEAHAVFVAEAEGSAVGFVSLDALSPSAVELGHLFVEPAYIGTRVGAALWDRAVAAAREQGFQTLVIQSDPHAEGFYLSRGAKKVGTRPSASIPGRQLPLLELALDAQD